jgi:hypothetical protein
MANQYSSELTEQRAGRTKIPCANEGPPKANLGKVVPKAIFADT